MAHSNNTCLFIVTRNFYASESDNPYSNTKDRSSVTFDFFYISKPFSLKMLLFFVKKITNILLTATPFSLYSSLKATPFASKILIILSKQLQNWMIMTKISKLTLGTLVIITSQ